MPVGTFRGQAQGKDWIVSRSLVSAGKGQKLVAEALDGSDYISLNLYQTQGSDHLRPCEMPLAKVLAFIADLTWDSTACN
jgi:hypothetical protein